MSNISLYKYSGDNRVLYKSLSDPLTKTVNIRTDIDIYNPVMLLQDFDLAYNYMLWDSRYYFINQARYTAKNVWQLQCHIDVLMTYYYDIISSSATIISAERNADKYMQGANIPVTSKPTIRNTPFPNAPFTRRNDNYILIATGGKVS